MTPSDRTSRIRVRLVSSRIFRETKAKEFALPRPVTALLSHPRDDAHAGRTYIDGVVPKVGLVSKLEIAVQGR
ncbi:hypothetical protein FHR92_004016 [Fontibacillus solani]|uniref:Uncharacterized protein n=1 Tax=Fontibacillus solani TaxID=1572857 RepID=A0A7W3XTF0_9BACL|nr:hypothetical protein [Fontibacillus solani]